MASIKCKLGNYIERREECNVDFFYGVDDVRGVNNLKQLMPTKADLQGRDLAKFQIIEPGDFVFNHRTSRHGDKFCIAINDGEKPVICTEDYVVFRIKKECEKELLREWLFMFFSRPECDRLVMYSSWGSSTEFFNWKDICDIDIELPSLPIQQKYVDVYKAMLVNQQIYDRGIEDLKVSIDALSDQNKHKAPKRTVGSILKEVDKRNEEERITEVHGINIFKQFMPSVADTAGVSLNKYKVVNKGQFAFSGMQTGRDECIRIALHNDSEPIIISPAYTVLETKDNSVIPEYIMTWFSREESDRRGWFMSDGSIRSNLDLDRFYETTIPVPDLEIQKAMVDIYKVYSLRKRIGEQLKNQIKDICPILIKGSIEEAKKEA